MKIAKPSWSHKGKFKCFLFIKIKAEKIIKSDHFKNSRQDPDAWPVKYPTCGGKQQSPINIHPNSTVRTTYPNFKFHNYGDIDRMALINNGHSG